MSWVTAKLCIIDSQLNATFPAVIFLKKLSLISATARACSVGWIVYLGDVYSLYFSPTICATESPEKLLLALKSGHLSDI